MKEVTSETVDLLVIGGGITGTAIARDAAMRGLRTVLVEQHDLAWGTSSRSSRLVHGGLRYLEQGNLRLVYEASRERRTLLALAPHLVRPAAFVFPVYRQARVPLWKLAAGLWLYDLLALFRNVKRHRILSKRQLLELEPRIRDKDLTGGALYYDAQCDDARLTVATARSAILHGAMVGTYMRVERLELVDNRARGARIRDRLTGERGLIRATTVVNATGPWTDSLRRLEFPHAPQLLRPTKGAHVVVERQRVGNTHALTITSPIDERVMFILPWEDLTIIGTTDTDSAMSPEDVRATQEDVIYLLRSANSFFPSARLTESDVLGTFAGLRPLLRGESSGAASTVSREHRIEQGPAGMWTIAGGKLTTCRSMAEELVDLVARELHQDFGRAMAPASTTAEEPLPGGEARELDPVRDAGRTLGLPEPTISHLLRLFGTEAAAIYNLCRDHRELMEVLHPGHPAIAAEVVHVTRRELACTLEDVLLRRLHLFYETPDHGLAAAAATARLMQPERGWDDRAAERAVIRYERTVRQRSMAPDPPAARDQET
ncbi:MAG: FAD-dependent oxidoreductase [Gemmatimonadales bacterium]